MSKMSTNPLFRYDAFLLDVDGVLVRGQEPIPGSPDALDALRRRGHVLLVTNNSTRSRRDLAAHLNGLGFAISPDETLPSSFAAAHHLLEAHGAVRVWIVGELGLRDELIDAGHRLAERPETAEWVVAGMCRHLDYPTLVDALKALRAGACLMATNDDATFPGTDGPMPGAGAVIGALHGMGHDPETLIGKPSPILFRLALRALGVSADRALMIGDRLETDIAGGAQAGMDTALVFTGIADRAAAAESAIRPTWTAETLADLADASLSSPVQ